MTETFTQRAHRSAGRLHSWVSTYIALMIFLGVASVVILSAAAATDHKHRGAFIGADVGSLISTLVLILFGLVIETFAAYVQAKTQD